jgi:UDP-N-acetylmuramoyl-L-alanyl-D-glutamate--2,6-diaminopimelate ligase
LQLQEILYKAKIIAVKGNTNINISGICIDSRNVQNGDLFIAVSGTTTDGHQYISNAVQNGAIAIICETLPKNFEPTVVYVQVADSAVASGIVSHNYFGEPSIKMKLIGVTGTNGKTTIATVLYKLFTALGYKCGLLSTVQNEIAGEVLPSTHTTPDAVSLNKLLALMVDHQCSHVFMEVSSHAIHQQRIAGLQFAGSIFTNITHDHLDYHKNFEEYIRVKKMLFDALPKNTFALINADDKRGMVMVQNTNANIKTYGLKSAVDFKGKILENGMSGLQMIVDELEVHFRLIGEFNAYNLLAVYGAAVLLGEDKQEVLRNLSMLTGADGRFDYFISPKEKITAIVDYAHTPDALKNVLATIKKLKKGFEQVITVVGCGGNRDKTKRPLMAAIACEYSNKVIFTSDNPRFEDPKDIINEMEAGVLPADKRKCISIIDRREAIKTAISLANAEAIVLIAGKGHEAYQEIKGIKNHFDDKEVVNEVFQLLDK